jgi:Zn-finger nucleic acid-binding protein
MTRSAVARRLACSIASVRRMEGSELHPTRDSRGVLRFDRGEVEAAAARRAVSQQHAQRGTEHAEPAPDMDPATAEAVWLTRCSDADFAAYLEQSRAAARERSRRRQEAADEELREWRGRRNRRRQEAEAQSMMADMLRLVEAVEQATPREIARLSDEDVAEIRSLLSVVQRLG